jgi:hypothetical protein
MAKERKSSEAVEAADAAADFYAQLVRRGLKPEEALSLAEQIGKAANSNANGHCAAPGRRQLPK